MERQALILKAIPLLPVIFMGTRRKNSFIHQTISCVKDEELITHLGLEYYD